MRLPMARTDPFLGVLTGAPLVLLPWWCFGLAAWMPDQADVLASLGSLLVMVAASVWLFLRPTALEVRANQLTVHFPMRTVDIPLGDLLAIETFSEATFRKRFGAGWRVRIASLCGGLGSLQTATDHFEAYITGHDSLVVLIRRSGRPVLLSPREPHTLVRELGGGLGATATGPERCSAQ